MKRRKTKNESRTPRGNEIVLANDPFGAFWRPLNKLASIAADGDNRSTPENQSPQAAGMPAGVIDGGKTPEPYEMNGSTAIIPIVGPLTKYPNFWDSACGWVFTLDVQAAISKALDDNAVETITLFIDSPGGNVSGTPDLGDFIAQAKIRKPIIAFVSDLCASGAYWLASQCTSIVANESAFIGSIGVYCVLADQSKAAEQFGVVLKLVSDGEFKGLTEPGLPIGDKAIAETQQIVSSIANLFRAAVGRGRNLDAAVVSQLADGRVHVASEALTLGLIDGIGTLEEAVQFRGTEMTTNANAPQNKNNAANPRAASDGTDGASGGDGSTPDVSEVCGKILDAVNALTEMVKKMTPSDDSASDKSNPDDSSGSADDASAKAVSADRNRLKAIMAACPGREKFAMEQFTAGATATEAKAALAGLLITELEAANKKLAANEDGANPIAGAQPQGGGARALADEGDGTDPEKVWAANKNNLQAAYRGRKERFLVAWKHGQTPMQLAAQNAADAA